MYFLANDSVRSPVMYWMPSLELHCAKLSEYCRTSRTTERGRRGEGGGVVTVQEWTLHAIFLYETIVTNLQCPRRRHLVPSYRNYNDSKVVSTHGIADRHTRSRALSHSLALLLSRAHALTLSRSLALSRFKEGVSRNIAMMHSYFHRTTPTQSMALNDSYHASYSALDNAW